MLDKLFNKYEICKKTWVDKYLKSSEKLPSDRIKEISKIVGMPDIYKVIMNTEFIPAGRILYGLGRDANVTFMNCYVIEILEDSIHGIFQVAEQIAEIYKKGGGVGLSLSALRPNGSKVNNAAEKSSGSVSFAHIYNTVTEIVGQKNRRGALMLLEDCQHPDIFEFIRLKDDDNKSQISKANISVLIRDRFMTAVEADADWELWYPFNIPVDVTPERYKTVKSINCCYDYPSYEYFYVESEATYKQKKVLKTIKAKELWDELVKRAHSSAEPGLVFIDTVKEDHLAEKFTPIVGTNPCGEQILPNYGACNLGALNLSAFIENKFTTEAYFNEDKFIEDVRLAVRFLDKIVDLNYGKNALKEQDELLKNYRRIGLGVMGFADMLAYLQIPYDSPSAFYMTENILELLEIVAWQESFELAKEHGRFPAFDPSMCNEGHLAAVISKGILDYEEVKKYGIRNASILSFAPTGSIALLAQCSSGIEPIFALEYTRRSESLTQDSFKIKHKAYEEYGKSDKPDFFKTAYEVNPIKRVKLQGLIQSFVDTGISVTVNLIKNTTIEEVDKIYKEAWKCYCKGITIYRDGTRQSILSTDSIREDYDILEGKTIVIPYKEKIYLTANFHPITNKLIEVFISSAKSGSDIRAIYEGLGRLISLYLQEGGEVQHIIKTLIDIRGEESIFTKGGIYHSIPDVIAKSLQKLANIIIVNKCPKCGSDLINEGGCNICKNCGHSKCD